MPIVVHTGDCTGGKRRAISMCMNAYSRHLVITAPGHRRLILTDRK